MIKVYDELIESDVCIICLEDFDEDSDIINKFCNNCNINAHKTCLEKWCKVKNDNICPICFDDIDTIITINDNVNNYNYTYSHLGYALKKLCISLAYILFFIGSFLVVGLLLRFIRQLNL